MQSHRLESNLWLRWNVDRRMEWTDGQRTLHQGCVKDRTDHRRL